VYVIVLLTHYHRVFVEAISCEANRKRALQRLLLTQFINPNVGEYYELNRGEIDRKLRQDDYVRIGTQPNIFLLLSTFL